VGESLSLKLDKDH